MVQQIPAQVKSRCKVKLIILKSKWGNWRRRTKMQKENLKKDRMNWLKRIILKLLNWNSATKDDGGLQEALE